ncbi:MAG: hypothetical protein GY797_17730, partial [Deltaproteobacteria bacterium]|nr:hypothetical protein [Deltaproteobacteria bacterium]
MPTYATRISEYKWPIFLNKFAKYKNKADRLGFPEPTYKILKDYHKTNDGITPLSHVYYYKDIEITYEMPIIDGWEVVGNRERLDGKIFTNVVTDDDCSSFHKSDVIGCGHCHTNRYRNKSILLKNKVGTIIEVGSTCVVDFFGHKVTKLDWFVDRIFEGDEWSGVGGGMFKFPLLKTLECTAFYIRKFGYMKASVPDYNTKERVWDCHLEPHFRCSSFVKPEITVEDENLAADALGHWASQDPTKNFHNSYVTNLIKIAEDSYLDPKLLGYAVSMVSSYQFHLEREAKKNAVPQVSKYQGNIGDRIKDIPVTLTQKKGWDGTYGWTDLLTMTDFDGNVFISFYTGTKSVPEVGQKFMLTGTIREHKEFNKVQQTNLNRIIWR